MLRITWDKSLPRIMFVGLNPSTADDDKDDPTVRRWQGFARDWGFGGVTIGNAFAYRSTDWRKLKTVSNPVGDRNDFWLSLGLIETEHRIVACWGRHIHEIDPARQSMLSKKTQYDCFGTNGDGTPKHPLYLSATTRLCPWNYVPEIVTAPATML